jgi:hypothetical protein
MDTESETDVIVGLSFYVELVWVVEVFRITVCRMLDQVSHVAFAERLAPHGKVI